jgi:hypothetical protein
MKTAIVMNFDNKPVTVKIGDSVCFKSDHEQCGEIADIIGSGTHAKLVLKNDNGFGGDYLRYATKTTQQASDCWVE